MTGALIPVKSQPYQIIEGASIVDAEVDDDGRMRFELSDGSFTRWVDVPNGEQGIPGDQGDPGDPGKDGRAATITMGSVAHGAAADAWMTGTERDRELNLTLPRGAKGARGDDGAPGPPGIASVTSPESGVWMIDQATDGDEDRLKDLQDAVYDKVARWELEAVETASKDDHDQLEARVEDLHDTVEQVSAAVPKAAWHGSVTVEFTGGSGSATVTFPTDLFSEPPLVMLTKNSARAARHVPYVGGVTPTSAQVGLYDPTSSSSTSESILCAVYAYLP